MKGYIYKYTFPNNKVYIGQTRRDPEIRHKEHISPVTGPTNSAFWKAYKEFGKCKFEVLYVMEDDDIELLVDKLNFIETQTIAIHKADNPDYGYNLKRYGASHAHHLTKEDAIIRKFIRRLHGSFLQERMNYYKCLEEKIWESNEELSQEEKEFVLQYSEDSCFDYAEITENLHCYRNTDDDELSFKLESMLSYLKFDIEEEANCEFEDFLEENFEEICLQALCEDSIVALDSEGNIVMEFATFNDIARHFNVPRADNVRNVLKGKQKTAYGYSWKHKNEL